MNLRQIFAPAQQATEAQLQSSRKIITCEGAVAGIVYSMGTGNFLAGYLSELGASVSFCAIVAMIPQLGCVLQLASPFLFERLRCRKLAVWLLCFLFRFLMGFVMLTPFFFGGKSGALPVVLVLYFVVFLAAGFVTPGLQRMVLEIAPKEHRGAFLARKEVITACVNSLATLAMGRQLDYFSAKDEAITGYFVIGGMCVGLSVLDAWLLGAAHEYQTPFVTSMRLQDILIPLRDAAYRPVLRYSMIGACAGGLSSSFLAVYLLRGLGLSHTFITSVGVVSAVVGMTGTWAWGRYADRTTWRATLLRTAFVAQLCTLCWFFIIPTSARIFAPVLLTAAAACGGGAGIANMNLQYVVSPAHAKTTYNAVTAAAASMVAVAAAAVGTSVQPILEKSIGSRSMAVLFLISGVLGLANLFFNGRRLPRV